MVPSGGLEPATFVERPNRFVVRARRSDDRVVDAHLPDPGRLVELLVPGAALRLRPAIPASTRKTRYGVALVRAGSPSGAWVSLEPARANGLVAPRLTDGSILDWGRGWHARAEVRSGASRFDFKLTGPRNRQAWIEVKSVTLVDGRGRARFPDAPTRRGLRHVVELARHAARGDRAVVLFVVQRSDARWVTCHDGIDPDFSRALRQARRRGVELRGVAFAFAADGRATLEGRLPVRLGN